MLKSEETKNNELVTEQNLSIDWPSHNAHKVECIEQALKNSGTFTDQKAINQQCKDTARIIIDQQQLSSLEELLEKISALPVDQYFIICELTTTKYRQAAPKIHKQLFDIFKLSDLVVADIESFEFISQSTLKTAKNQLEAYNIIKQLGLKQLLLHDSLHNQWLYLSEIAQAKLAHVSSSLMDQHARGSLSAAIACFIHQGKRVCDAIVLAIAYLQQNLSIRESQQLDFSLGAKNLHPALFCWPLTLQHYPQMTTDLCTDALQPFAKTDSLSLGLYPVVDSIEWLEKLLRLSVKTIQLRIKNTADEELDRLIAKASELGKEYKARLFINDYWQLAIKHQCYGVHLGQEDIGESNLLQIQQAGLKLGVSTHSEFEWLRAIAIKPSYIAMGTVYPTQTKPAILIGLNNLRRWNATLKEHYPVVAIGGIKLTNIDEVLNTNVGSVALVTAITLAEDYIEATQRLQDKVNIGGRI